jgi:hypothetical protein
VSALLSSEVAAHMASLPRTSAEPRVVVVDGQERSACRFCQVRESSLPGEGSETYVHSGLYVLGLVPGSYRMMEAEHGTAPMYVDQDGVRWYVAGWADGQAARSHPEFHPFGVWFLLQRVSAGLRRAGFGDRAPLVRFEWRAA